MITSVGSKLVVWSVAIFVDKGLIKQYLCCTLPLAKGSQWDPGEVGQFPYLWSRILAEANIVVEVRNHFQCNSRDICQLRKSVLKIKALGRAQNPWSTEHLVSSVLLYASKIWMTYRKHLKALENYHCSSPLNPPHSVITKRKLMSAFSPSPTSSTTSSALLDRPWH